MCVLLTTALNWLFPCLIELKGAVDHQYKTKTFIFPFVMADILMKSLRYCTLILQCSFHQTHSTCCSQQMVNTADPKSETNKASPQNAEEAHYLRGSQRHYLHYLYCGNEIPCQPPELNNVNRIC